MPDWYLPKRLEWLPVGFVTVALGALHLLDDAAWHTPRGAHVRHGLVIALPLLLVLVAWAAATVMSRSPVQVALLFVASVLLAFDFGLHVVHARDSGVSGSDVTGLLLVLPAVALLATAVAVLARPKPARTVGRRWAARIGAVAVGVALALLVVMPLGLAMTAAHKPAMDVPQAALPAGHREISLKSGDGYRLAASYVPPRLTRHGFGVLLLDARGSGESSGRPENLGWTWPRDIRAAVDWLAARSEVKHIGGLGLSTGAEALLDAAAHDRRIAAVIADGTQARQASELRVLPSGGTKTFTWWELTVAQNAYRAMTHAPRPEPLDRLIPRIAPRPVLLIAASDNFERQINEAYAKRAGVGLWSPDATPHTGGLKTHPREYEERVTRFFARMG